MLRRERVCHELRLLARCDVAREIGVEGWGKAWGSGMCFRLLRVAFKACALMTRTASSLSLSSSSSLDSSDLDVPVANMSVWVLN
jgi:hypothetical protein